MTESLKTVGSRKLRVALVAPSLRTIGGQGVQADLLMRNWQGGVEVETTFVPIDPKLPRALKWLERIPYV